MDLMQLGYGLLEQEDDPRDFTAETLGLGQGDRHQFIELPLPGFVYDQGKTMMCTAYAASMMMYMINGMKCQFSAADSYRQKTTPGEGATLRDTMKSLYHNGIALKMVYDANGTFEDCKDIYELHKTEADFVGELGRIRHYYKVLSEGDVVTALNNGTPLLAGMTIYENFIPDDTGHAPLPEGKLVGGHAVLIVGHKPGYVKILNSWGEEWGINGTAWMPYSMVNMAYAPIDASMKVKNIYFQIGLDFYIKNGEKHIIDVAPRVENGRTLVPLRAVADAMDLETEYWPAGKTIYLKG